jgi:hypothetical protein
VVFHHCLCFNTSRHGSRSRSSSRLQKKMLTAVHKWRSVTTEQDPCRQTSAHRSFPKMADDADASLHWVLCSSLSWSFSKCMQSYRFSRKYRLALSLHCSFRSGYHMRIKTSSPGKKQKQKQQLAGMKFCWNDVIFASAVNWSHVLKWRIWTERYGKHHQVFHNVSAWRSSTTQHETFNPKP